MTDQLPSKEKVRRFRQRADKGDVIESDWGEFVLYADYDRLQRENDTCGLECSATLKSLVAENEELRRDLARTESAHAVVMAENAHYKQKAAEREQWAAAWHQALETVATVLEVNSCGSPSMLVRDINEAINKLRAAQPPGDGQQ